MARRLIHEDHKQEVFRHVLVNTADCTPLLVAAISQNNPVQDVKGLQNNVKREKDLPCRRVARVMYPL